MTTRTDTKVTTMTDLPLDPADGIGPLDATWQRNLAAALRKQAAASIATAEARERLADTLDTERAPA